MRLLCASLLSVLSLDCVAQNVVNPFADPIATTVQLPTFGISVDAEGVLKTRTHADPDGRLMAARIDAARRQRAGDLGRATPLRYVSLVRLEEELSKLLQRGQAATDEMRHLAGLTRLESAFCFPASGQIIIAGPAEPWVENLAGSAVGLASGRPTLLLQDLVVALRAYRPEHEDRRFVGCTINPTVEGLTRLRALQAKIPKAIRASQRDVVTQQVAQGVRESLGMAEIKVFGISPRTHFAAVLIEADYRMKRIAIGVEPAPVPMTTFAEALTSARNGRLERWWFTPAYDGVLMSPDSLAMKIDGQGVRLQTEHKQIALDGTLRDAGRPSRATLAYANSFTTRYPKIAAASPVYAQLRQLVDLLILAAFLRQHDWYEQADWRAKTYLDEAAFSVERLTAPLSAPVVVNTFWKANRLFTPAGGGVSIEAENALGDSLRVEPGLEELQRMAKTAAKASWWWDAP